MSTQRALMLVQLRRWNDAKEALAPVLADPDTDARGWCLLAQCELGLGDPREARIAAQRAIVVEPESEWAYRLLALALLRSRRRREAEQAAEKAVAIAPDKPETVHLLVQARLSRRRPEPVQEIAARCLAANPESTLAWQTCASVAVHRQDWSETERFARGGLALNPQNADLMLLLGLAQQAQGFRAEAADSYAAAVRIDPTNDQGRRALGTIGLSFGGFSVLSLVMSVLVSSILLQVPKEGWQDPWFLTLLAGVLLALVYGFQELQHRRVVAKINPQLRAPALAGRRRVGRIWLAVVAAAAAGLAVPALVLGDLTLLGVLVGVAGLAMLLRDRWTTRGELSDRKRIGQQLRSLAQIRRWRFR